MNMNGPVTCFFLFLYFWLLFLVWLPRSMKTIATEKSFFFFLLSKYCQCALGRVILSFRYHKRIRRMPYTCIENNNINTMLTTFSYQFLSNFFYFSRELLEIIAKETDEASLYNLTLGGNKYPIYLFCSYSLAVRLYKLLMEICVLEENWVLLSFLLAKNNKNFICWLLLFLMFISRWLEEEKFYTSIEMCVGFFFVNLKLDNWNYPKYWGNLSDTKA